MSVQVRQPPKLRSSASSLGLGAITTSGSTTKSRATIDVNSRGANLPARESSAPRGATLSDPKPGMEVEIDRGAAGGASISTQAGAIVLQHNLSIARLLDSGDYANSDGWFQYAEDIQHEHETEYEMREARRRLLNNDRGWVAICERACRRAAEQRTATVQTTDRRRVYRMTRSR